MSMQYLKVLGLRGTYRCKRYLKFQDIQEVPIGPGFWGEVGDRQTDKQTQIHMNSMTWPGLGAGPSENSAYGIQRNCWLVRCVALIPSKSEKFKRKSCHV